MVKVSDIIKLEKPNELSSRYDKAFEKAVLVLLKEKDNAAAMRAFIEHCGKKELVELKSHILRKEEWKTKAE